MRELSTPSLFDPPPATPVTVAPPPESNEEEQRHDRLARDFIRWCFSFGSGFRNSPDVINLRNWARKTRMTFKPAEENVILVEAWRLHAKRIDQQMKKSEAPSILGGE